MGRSHNRGGANHREKAAQKRKLALQRLRRQEAKKEAKDELVRSGHRSLYGIAYPVPADLLIPAPLKKPSLLRRLLAFFGWR